jgi:hypothetical protein
VLGRLNCFIDATFSQNIVLNENINSYGSASLFDDNLEVSKILYVGKLSITQISLIDVTGTIYLRDPSDLTVVYMKMYYEPSLYGFVFQDETSGRNMNFRIKKSGGEYSLFYFSSSQLYASMGVYFDN